MRLAAATIERGDTPLIATAVHNGHTLRREVADLIALDENTRLREEDPYTGPWTEICKTRIVGVRSRFEVDLNRPREKAVYLAPEEAWGLHVWQETPPKDVLDRSLAQYDEFYSELRQLLDEAAGMFGRFVILDLHSYNYRRDGMEAPPEDNPDLNVGTRSLENPRWRPVVERFMSDVSAYDYMGRHLDVRENVRFGGGHLAQWTNAGYYDTGCCLALDFKKFFMDERTGEADHQQLAEIKNLLSDSLVGLLEELDRL